MMNDLSIMGRLVECPELKKTASGISVTKFRIACERDYSKPGEARPTDFFDVVAWRGTAEFAEKWFGKGDLIAISGSIQNREWEDRHGQKRVSTEIVANKLHFAGHPARKDERALGIEPDDADFSPVDESQDLPF